MNRNVKKLLMLSVLGLSTSLVACEKAGDLTGPSQQAASAPSAIRIGGLRPDTLGLVVDSLDVQVQGAYAPPPPPSDPESKYGITWP